jgi:N-acetylmuramoyl-L-alanine amidase
MIRYFYRDMTLRVAARRTAASVLLLSWVWTSDPASVRAHTDDSPSLEEAQTCRKKLLASTSRQRLRSHWERCITLYEEVLDHNRLPVRHRRAALHQIGSLHQGLYQQSHFSSDYIAARTRYLEALGPDAAAADPPDSRIRADLNRLEASHRQFAARQGTALVTEIRSWNYPEYTRLVLDLSREIRYRSENSSDAMQVHLLKTELSLGALETFSKIEGRLPAPLSVRQSRSQQVTLIIPLNGLSRPPRPIPLSEPPRLVLDLFSQKAADSESELDIESAQEALSPAAPDAVAAVPPRPMRIQTIVLDPGHGGKDPGAIGRRGLTEKEVVLDIALRVRKLIESRLDQKVLMTRDKDVFIPLDDRSLMANAAKADLFVSIHANSSPRRSTRGVEVYLLGEATDEHALAVAARENNASAGSTQSILELIKSDLTEQFNTVESVELAHFTRKGFLRTFDNRFDIIDLGVKRAPFFVLVNTHMPAILAEVSFISNSTEEKWLKQGRYRQLIAEAIFDGIKAYIVANHRPTG